MYKIKKERRTMTDRENFIKYVETVTQFCKDNGMFDEELDFDVDKAFAFFDKFVNETPSKREGPTDKGIRVLEYMVNSDKTEFKSSEIAKGLFIASRQVTGSMRKLFEDGYVEKVTEPGISPIVYRLSDKGIEYVDSMKQANE